MNSYKLLLGNTLDSLSSQHEDIAFIRLDIHALFLDIITDPGDFGFINVTETAYIPDEEKEFFGSQD